MSLAETVTRIGYIHIPGSMGTSISEACGRSLNVRYLPIHAIVGDTDGNTDDSFTIKVPKNPDSLTRHLLLSYPLIAGHLSVGQIQATYRTHIFTLITEPRKRLIKLFAHHAKKVSDPLCIVDGGMSLFRGAARIYSRLVQVVRK